jgi:hypothetical protein
MVHKKETVDEEPKTESDVLEHLFGSKTRVRLLRLFLDKPDRAYFVREITRRVESQLNSVRREVENMVSLGLLKETVSPIDLSTVSNAVRGASSKKRYYQANTDFIFFEELQSIVRKSSMLLHDLLLAKLPDQGQIELLIFTGKMMEAPVPTDVLVVSNMKSDLIREAITSFEHELGREVNYTHMPLDEYKYRKEVRDRFLESIFQNKHLIVYAAPDLKK